MTRVKLHALKTKAALIDLVEAGLCWPLVDADGNVRWQAIPEDSALPNVIQERRMQSQLGRQTKATH